MQHDIFSAHSRDDLYGSRRHRFAALGGFTHTIEAKAMGWFQQRSVATRQHIAQWLIGGGMLAVIYYASWWMEYSYVYHPLLLLALLVSLAYHSSQVLAAWYIYLQIQLPAPPPPVRPNLRVDVFIPVYDEADELVQTCLRAAIQIRYPHRTYLLDDRPSPARRAMAKQLDVGYLTRPDNRDAKAGNVNHALAQTTGEFVAVFDVDHIPTPEFLDRVLGYFADPQVGFVQAMVAHGNQTESFVALAAADQAYDVFSPTCLGMHGCGAAPVWGAHCTFRRSALESIGGHQTGLAEDLHTSLALHAAGWRSVYVPEVLARGLVPADLLAYIKQQLKWSRGVFTILFEQSLPRLRKLHPAQMIAYFTRMTYYLMGLVALINMGVTALVLYLGGTVVSADFASYMQHWLPLMFMVLLIRKVLILSWERDPQARHASFAGIGLAFGMWPVHTLTLLCALLRVKIPHIATPKQANGGNFLPLIIPQICAVLVLAGGIGYRLALGVDWSFLAAIGFALLSIVLHIPVFYAAWEGYQLTHHPVPHEP